jgi:hypothetical protein
MATQGDRFDAGSPFAFLKTDRQTLWDQFVAARMAKLVDAPGLGPDASNGVGVRVPLLAPDNLFNLFGRFTWQLLLKPWKNSSAALP